MLDALVRHRLLRHLTPAHAHAHAHAHANANAPVTRTRKASFTVFRRVAIPPLPRPGRFDLRQVRSSVYFFS